MLWINAQRPRNIRRLNVFQPRPLLGHLNRQFCEGLFSKALQHAVPCLRQTAVRRGRNRTHQFIARLRQQQPLVALLQYIEVRRHVRLYWKALQHTLAKAVHRLDPDAARRLLYLCEQATGAVDLIGGWRLAEEVGQVSSQVCRIRPRPQCQPVGDAVGHLASGSFGEG